MLLKGRFPLLSSRLHNCDERDIPSPVYSSTPIYIKIHPHKDEIEHDKWIIYITVSSRKILRNLISDILLIYIEIHYYTSILQMLKVLSKLNWDLRRGCKLDILH